MCVKEKFNKLFLIFVLLLLTTCCDKMDNCWYVDYLELNKIHTLYTGRNQIITIIDSGLSSEYQNIYHDSILYKYNLIDNNDKVQDNNGHGTEIIKLILGDEDLIGIAPDVKIIILKIVDENGTTNDNLLLKALRIAKEKNSDVVNISLGSYKENSKVKKQIKDMIDANISIVASVGDDGNKDILFPACLKEVFAIEAIDKNGNLYEDSNITDSKDTIPFPGVELMLFKDDNLFGSSYATAITSGYITLLREYYNQSNIDYNNDYIMKQLDELKIKNISYKDLFDI